MTDTEKVALMVKTLEDVQYQEYHGGMVECIGKEYCIACDKEKGYPYRAVCPINNALRKVKGEDEQ